MKAQQTLGLALFSAFALSCGGASHSSETQADGSETGLPDAAPQASQHVQRAEGQMAEGNFTAAKESLQNAIEADSKDARAYYNMGIVEEELENLAEAEAAYRLALNAAPAFTFAAINLGRLLHQMDRGEEAVPVLEGALAQAPDSAEAHFNLGVVLNALGKTDAALEHHEKATELSPDDMNAWLRVAWLRFAKEDQEGAAKAAARAYALSKQEAKGRPLAELGSILRLTSQPKEAIETLDRALADTATFANLTPELRAEAKAAVLTERGMAQSAIGRTEAARESYQQAIEHAVTYPLAHYALGNLLANQQEWKPAVAAYTKFLELAQPEDPNAKNTKDKLKKIRELIGKKPRQ